MFDSVSSVVVFVLIICVVAFFSVLCCILDHKKCYSLYFKLPQFTPKNRVLNS